MKYSNKFNLGDIVATKLLGQPVIAMIVGILDINLYMHNHNYPHDVWEKIYPDWKEHPVYTLLFETPIRSVSLIEFKNLNIQKNNITIPQSETEWKLLYEWMVPPVKFVYHPEQDIEIFEYSSTDY